MKNILLLSVAVFAIGFAAAQNTTAANPKYVAAMEKQIAQLDTARTAETYQNIFNNMERIANAEKTEWLPRYYMAYCLVMQSYQADVKKVDDYCDRADVLLNKADSLHPNDPEIYIVRSMIYSARIRVNPMTRGGKFGGQAGEWLNKATQLDSLNPRAALLRGQALYYTPPAFGGGKDKAKPVLEDAVKKFDAFKPVDTIHPNWGRSRAVFLLAEYNKK